MSRVVTIKAPLRLVSRANQRQHWTGHWRRDKEEQLVVRSLLNREGDPPPPPVTVELTRVAPRSLDSDNLQGAFKAVRDAVAAWLGIDDGDDRIEWRYAQRQPITGEKSEKYAVLVAIWGREAAA